MKNWSLLFFCLGLLAFGGSCSNSSAGSSADIPLVKPPVEASTPSGLVSSRRSRSLDIDEIKSRFFSDGPTEVSNLLDSIDTRVNEINTRSTENDHTCLANTPVEEMLTINGSTQTAYFQCYDVFGDGSGGMLFGTKDGVWYLFTNVGQGISYSTIQLVDGTSDKYKVESWMSVGRLNSDDADTCSSHWYGCSYGVIHLKANSADSTFEMTVAGTGFGYCGAQLKSDGTNLYVTGSTGQTSDGSSWTCNSTDTACTMADDTGTAGTCTSIDDDNFELTSLGVTGHSDFGSDVTLNGTDSDSVHFGWSVEELQAITGVSAF